MEQSFRKKINVYISRNVMLYPKDLKNMLKIPVNQLNICPFNSLQALVNRAECSHGLVIFGNQGGKLLPSEVRLIRKIKKNFQNLKLILICKEESLSGLRSILRSGADAILMERDGYAEMRLAIHQIREGESFYSESFIETLFQQSFPEDKSPFKSTVLASEYKLIIQRSKSDNKEFYKTKIV